MDVLESFRRFVEDGNNLEARTFILENETAYEGNKEFLKVKSLYHIANEQYDEAIKSLKTAREIDPNDSEVYYYLSQIYEFLIEDDSIVTIINSDGKSSLEYSDYLNLYQNRALTYELSREKDDPLVSIVFIAYNNLEKLTKPAIDCLLKYTEEIDYELILIDNGSTDGTIEFFKDIKFKKKKIYRITKNIGAFYGHLAARNNSKGRFVKGKYIVDLPNDVLVTENWLKNMLRCIESDESIGMVVPMSDNVSNLQSIDLRYDSFFDMQKKAKEFNKSDPQKWEERNRLIPFMSLRRVEVDNLIGKGDDAFIYEFSDDDYSLRIRRAGYKLVLCGDTFVHHEATLYKGERVENLKKGMNIFRKKYYGLDAWEDIIPSNQIIFYNFVSNSLKEINDKPSVLGIDIAGGAILFFMKNLFKQKGKDNYELKAFIQEAKFYNDLYDICQGQVICDRIEHFMGSFIEDKFDNIFIGKYINNYNNYNSIIKSSIEKLKVNGVIVFMLKNIFDITALLKRLEESNSNQNFINIDPEQIEVLCSSYANIKIEFYEIKHNEVEDYYKEKLEILLQSGLVNTNSRLLIDKYLVVIKKYI